MCVLGVGVPDRSVYLIHKFYNVFLCLILLKADKKRAEKVVFYISIEYERKKMIFP